MREGGVCEKNAEQSHGQIHWTSSRSERRRPHQTGLPLQTRGTHGDGHGGNRDRGSKRKGRHVQGHTGTILDQLLRHLQ